MEILPQSTAESFQLLSDIRQALEMYRRLFRLQADESVLAWLESCHLYWSKNGAQALVLASESIPSQYFLGEREVENLCIAYCEHRANLLVILQENMKRLYPEMAAKVRLRYYNASHGMFDLEVTHIGFELKEPVT